MPPDLITLTGPIAAGKNTVESLLADRLVAAGRRVVVLDLDDVVFAARSTGQWDPWPAARRIHGVLVGQWLRDGADVVIAVGPFHVASDDHALLAAVDPSVVVTRVLIEAPLEVTWARAQTDATRGLSRERDFHEAAHARYLGLRSAIPADLFLDSATEPAEVLARRIHEHLSRADRPEPVE